jgi:hypothetical protein
MHRIIFGLAAIALGLSLAAPSAHAQYNTPFKGKQFKVNLMTTYEPCTAPDTTTDDGFPACTTIVRTDTTCGWGGGQGKIQLKTQTVGNYGARLKLTSLDAACEGETLQFIANVRRTGHYCSGNVCTIQDQQYQFGSCIVQHRLCKVSGIFVWPGGQGNGNTELKDIWVMHNGLRVFDMGLVENNPQH